MKISEYYQSTDGSTQSTLSFTEQQASDFAKGVAGDFNPIHDPGSRRFCVPGDLLFAVMLDRFGVASHMEVQFASMLTADSSLVLPSTIDESLTISDDREREVLSLSLSGERYNDSQLVAGITTAYVQFSGKTFPDILVPLMRDAHTMINPQRPLVIYKDMSLSLDEKALKEASIDVDGRKGMVKLDFVIHAGKQQIGIGTKHMVLGGLRDFDEDEMGAVVTEYHARREQFQQGS